MAKALKFASYTSKVLANGSAKLLPLQKTSVNPLKQCISKINSNVSANLSASSRAYSTLSSVVRPVFHSKGCCCPMCSKTGVAPFSTEVDKEISKFLTKEIEYEQSKGSSSLPKIPGFEIVANGGDVTLTKTSGKEKIVVKLSVNGAVDCVMSENPTDKENDPPQMICRPPFDIEISKGDGKKLVIECSFAQNDSSYIEEGSSYDKSRESDQIDDQFEIHEISFQEEGSADGGYSVSASTMDAELFDLLMDMLDERGINDEFIVHLVDYCTAYENQQYIGFLKKLQSFADK